LSVRIGGRLTWATEVCWAEVLDFSSEEPWACFPTLENRWPDFFMLLLLLLLLLLFILSRRHIPFRNCIAYQLPSIQRSRPTPILTTLVMQESGKCLSRDCLQHSSDNVPLHLHHGRSFWSYRQHMNPCFEQFMITRYAKWYFCFHAWVNAILAMVKEKATHIPTSVLTSLAPRYFCMSYRLPEIWVTNPKFGTET